MRNLPLQNLSNKITCSLLLIFSLCFNLTGIAQTQTFLSSGTWTCPAGVSTVTVQCWGGGGAGGSARANSGAVAVALGGGGAGGAYATKVIPVTPGTVYTVTVGAGGIATTGTVDFTVVSGNPSWFGSASTVFAEGGEGGESRYINTNTKANGAGGTGSSASSIGTTVFRGGNGGTPPANTSSIPGGGGGSSAGTASAGNSGTSGGTAGLAVTGGGAGGAGSNSVAGIAGSFPGGGGGGSRSPNTTQYIGGNGGNGQVIISYTQLTYKSLFISASTGSANWCAGETRTVSVTVKNNGTATWTNTGADINIGVKWNAEADYFVRTDANNLAPGATQTYNLTVTAPATAGANNLTFDMVYEMISWFGDNFNGVGPGNVKYISTPAITINALPAAPTGTSTQSFCASANPTVGSLVAAGTGIKWYSVASGGTALTAGTALVNGTVYYASQTNAAGCESTSRLPVTVSLTASGTIALSSAAGTDAQVKCINTAITPIKYNIAGNATGAVISAGSLPAGVSGVYSAGVFTITGTASVSGIFNYTVSTTGSGCVNPSLSGSITVTPDGIITLASAPSTTSQNICVNTSVTPVSYTISGSATGASVSALPAGLNGVYSAGTFVISGNPSVSGTFPFTVTTTGSGCINQSSGGTITINPAPVTPPAQPTGLLLTATGTGTITGSFSASAASGYVVVRTATSTPALAPVNGTVYIPGASALGGIIVSAGSSTSFVSGGLSAGTAYWFWVFAYNSGSCAVSPKYLVTAPLNASATTLGCGIPSLYWAGAGSVLTGAGTGTDFNDPSNWSYSSAVFNAAGYSPTACDNVVMKITGAANIYLTGNTSMNALNLYQSGNNNNTVIDLNGYNLVVNTTSTLDVLSGNDHTNITITNSNALASSTLEFKGNIQLGPDVNNLAIQPLKPAVMLNQGSGGGVMNLLFRGDADFGSLAAIAVAAGNAPQSMIFDGTGTQNIRWNNRLYRMNFRDVIVGSVNSPVVNYLTGTVVPDNITGNLTVNNNAVLNLGTSQLNRNVTGGSFNMNGNSKLILSATTSLQVLGTGIINGGSNFPGGFTSAMSAGSKVEYNAGSSITQVIYPSVVYGSLELTNSTGSGQAVKQLSSNINGIAGDLIIHSNVKFNLLTYTINRPAMGGTIFLEANAYFKIGGASGGTSGSNFPLNFSSYIFDKSSTTDYNGTSQTIYGGPLYGNLVLSGNTAVNAAAGTLTLAGNLAKTSSAVFAHNTGTIIFAGTGAAQTYNSVSPAMTFNNLSNLNVTGLNVSDTLNIAGELLLGASSKLNIADTKVIVMRSALSKTANLAAVPSSAIINYNSSGRFIVERYIPTGVNHTKSWQLLSAPTNGQSIRSSWMEGGLITSAPNGYGTWVTGPGGAANGFDVATANPSVKYYNALTDSWMPVSNTLSTQLNAKQGYLVFVRGDRSVFNFSGPNSASNETILRSAGTINTGNQPVIPVSLNKFELVGNPYPSPVDFEAVAKVGIGNIFYAWDPTLNGAYGLGGYQTISKIGSLYLATPGGAGIQTAGATPIYNSTSDYRYIQSGQAFFVRGKTATNSISFTESGKSSASTGMLVNRGTSGSRMLNNFSMLSTSLFAVNNGITSLADGNRYISAEAYSHDINEDDAMKIMNGGENFSIIKSGQKFAVATGPSITQNDTLHFMMSGLKAQPYRLQFSMADMDISLRAELIDKFLNSRTSISTSVTSTVNFVITSDVNSQAADRFLLIFNKVAGPLPVTITSVHAERNTDRSITVNWKVENEINILKYDVERSSEGRSFSGILSTTASAGSGGSASYNRTDLQPMPGDNYYRVRATGIDGKLQYSPVVKVVPVKSVSSIYVSPNPVEGKIVQLHFTNQPAGKYDIQLMNNAGQVIYKGMVEVQGTSFVKPLSLGEFTPAGTYQLFVVKTGGTTFSQQVIIE